MPTKRQTIDNPLSPPSLTLLALECRAPWEFGALLPTLPLLSRAPAGDGHSVIVFPGLSANDTTTVPLRRYLKWIGYDCHGWHQGFNFGPRAGVLASARRQLTEACETSGGKVSLIGWSLGGVYARELAKEYPDQVRNVITLGTPFAASPQSTHAWRFYELASGRKIADEINDYKLHEAPLVPTTSIYSRTDGIVSWRGSIQAPHKTNRKTENLEVIASHLGLGINPSAWWAVADRLAQPEGQWRAFERKSGLHGLIFPDPNR